MKRLVFCIGITLFGCGDAEECVDHTGMRREVGETWTFQCALCECTSTGVECRLVQCPIDAGPTDATKADAAL